jgi:GNAT superfamily N-acetyltransferase
VLEIVLLHGRDSNALAPLRRLLAEYDANLPPMLRVPDMAAEMRLLADRYVAPAAALLIARDETGAVGCVLVKPLDATTAEIKRLYVVPAARRSGAGRALMEAAIEFARGRGSARVVLDTERDLLAGAYRLYRCLGFEICAPYADADYATPTFMELRFDRPGFNRP